MKKVSVNLKSPSPYVEKDNVLHRIKRRLSYSNAFRLIRRFSGNSPIKSLLEIGTGSGYFLSNCLIKLPDCKLFGVEYDDRLVNITLARAPHAYCIQGNAETFNLLPMNFDVVVSFQVIEHLYNPLAMLERVRSHLNEGGLFVMTSPNLSSVGAKLMGKRWHGYRDDHVSLKSFDEWVSLIESAGFKNVYSGSTFFTGIPFMNKLPLGLINWLLLVIFGSLKWKCGESYVGVFVKK